MFSQLLHLYIERWDFFLSLTLEHLGISAVSIGLASVLGLLLGILISECRKSTSLVLSAVNFAYTIPAISLLGILMPFTGIGNLTAVIALTIYALLPMVRNTYAGLTNIDPAVIEAATGMGSTRSQLLCRIKLPLAVPVILSGLRSMVVMTIALAGIASFIGAGGLGVAIYRGITTNNGAMTLAGSLLIALLALVLDSLLGGVEMSLRRKRRMDPGSRGRATLAVCLLALSAVVLPGCSKGERSVTVATKPMTEQFILGKMLAALIRQDAGLEVRVTPGVGGGTGNIHPALLKGDFDLYPEYMGTAWLYVLKKRTIPDDASLFRELTGDYSKEFHLDWVGLYGFNNTFGLAVRREVADAYHLRACSDLAAVAPELVFGAEYDFYEREDGFRALCDAYGLHFKKQVDMDIGLKYPAIRKGEIDVMTVFTTDGQLASSDVVLLDDDRHFYHTYYCGTVIREDTLRKFPKLRPALMKMDGLIDNATMSRLNNEVESNGRDAKTVALEFLKQKGLLRD